MIAVVGGGVTGLAIGRELARRDADFVVLEADDRAGGVVRTTRADDGRPLDWGPQRARRTPDFARLVGELGLEAEMLTAPQDLDLFVWRHGRLRRVPFSWADLLATDLVGPGAKARLLLEPLTAGADREERVSTYFERKVGRDVYEALVGPLFGGLYGSDPADMEVGVALAPLLRRLGVGRSLVATLVRRGRLRPAPAVSFRAGMQALPDALAGSLGARLRLGVAVVSVARHRSGWRLRCSNGSAIDAEHVVVTSPAPVAAGLLEGAAPAAAARFRALRYNPLAIVHVDVESELRGLGFQVAFGGAAPLLRGVTFHHAIFGRRNLHTVFLGGALRPEVAGMTEDALAEAAVAELRRTLGLEGRPLAAAHVRMPAWDLSWRGLAAVALPPGLHVAGSWWSRPGLPGRFAEARRIAATLTGDTAPH